jgi:hypothetical protein
MELSMFDIDRFMMELATKRPIFHSEADFQHAFAWQLHEQFPDAKIRLEYPINVVNRRIYLDIFFTSPQKQLAIELKYKTRQIEVPNPDERYLLKGHSAQDIGRYDYLKDVSRLEQVSKNTSIEGYAILLTNDSGYWAGKVDKETIDMNFRLFEGREVNGSLAWLAHAGKGTTKNRTEPINISGRYPIQWKDYSQVSTHLGRTFKYLIFHITPLVT